MYCVLCVHCIQRIQTVLLLTLKLLLFLNVFVATGINTPSDHSPKYDRGLLVVWSLTIIGKDLGNLTLSTPLQ